MCLLSIYNDHFDEISFDDLHKTVCDEKVELIYIFYDDLYDEQRIELLDLDDNPKVIIDKDETSEFKINSKYFEITLGCFVDLSQRNLIKKLRIDSDEINLTIVQRITMFNMIKTNESIDKLTINAEKYIKNKDKKRQLVDAIEECIKNGKHIKTFKLTNTWGDDEFIKPIFNGLKDNKSIDNLVIDNTHHVNIGYELAKVIEHNKTIKRIENYNDDIIGKNCEAVCSALQKNTTLDYIKFTCCELGDREAIYFAEMLTKNSTLKKLRLSHNSFTVEGAEILAKGVAKNNGLTKLQILGIKMMNKGADAIINASKGHPSLKEIMYWYRVEEPCYRVHKMVYLVEEDVRVFDKEQ